MNARLLTFPFRFGIGLLVSGASIQITCAQDQEGAFGGETAKTLHKDVTDNPDYQKAADEFLSNVQTAFETGDGEKVSALFDFAKIVDVCDARGLIPEEMSDKARLAAIMEQSFGQQFGAWAGFLAFDEHRIVRIEEFREDHIVVYARLWNDELEIFGKMRWWLFRSDEGWRTYDFEDFDANQRFTTMFGLGIRLAGKQEPWMPELIAVFHTMQQTGGDLEVAMQAMVDERERLKKLLSEKMPLALESALRAMLISGYMYELDAEQALQEIEIALKAEPDGVIFEYMKGSALTALEKWDEALVSFDRYGAKLGWDADLYGLTASAHLGAGRTGEAIDHSLKGLADHHEAWFCLEVLCQALPENRKPEIEAHFKKLSDQDGAYEYLMDVFLYEAEDLATAKALQSLMKKLHPDNELIESYDEEISDLSA